MRIQTPSQLAWYATTNYPSGYLFITVSERESKLQRAKKSLSLAKQKQPFYDVFLDSKEALLGCSM